MRIKDLHSADRPREKLAKYGPDKLSDAELLAILLRSGTKGENVIELAKKILKSFADGRLATASVSELVKTFGLGTAKASEVVACFELGRRFLKDKQHNLVLGPQKVWELLADIRASKKEHFVVFYLDSRSQEIEREIVSVGTLNASLVHPRDVFEQAIKHSAAQIIIAHNHPSGNPEPSHEDTSAH